MVSLSLIITLASCEDQQLVEGTGDELRINGDLADSGTTSDQLPKPYNESLADLVALPAELLIPYADELTADGGSHRWIFRLDQTGTPKSGILFLTTQNGDGSSLDAFEEVPTSEGISRTPLKVDDAEAALGTIERHLISIFGEARYRFFYEGGTLEERAQPERDTPFSSAGFLDPDGEELLRVQKETADWVNQKTLWSIAGLIRDYRVANKVEQADAGNRGRR